MAQRDEMVRFLDEYLSITTIEDASNNGLQMQGGERVETVGLAVDAGLETYRKAVGEACDLLLVHHGFIWHGLPSVTGVHYQHVKYLLDNRLNLYAAHLPLDLHPESGNNIVLARILGLSNIVPFGIYKGRPIGFAGDLTEPGSTDGIATALRTRLGGDTLVLPFGPACVRRVGIVSGGGGDCLPEAVEKGIDCFVTGEPDHENHHAALEGHVNVVYCGHYHSEQVGVKAMGEVLAKRFGVKTVFLDVPTLV